MGRGLVLTLVMLVAAGCGDGETVIVAGAEAFEGTGAATDSSHSADGDGGADGEGSDDEAGSWTLEDVEPCDDGFYTWLQAGLFISCEESHRRNERSRDFPAISRAIRDHEASRVAGWWVEHGYGPESTKYIAVVWLAGDDPPGEEAAAIADRHDDVEIRTGAAHTYEELKAARDRLSSDLSSGCEALPDGVCRLFTGIDTGLKDNRIEVGFWPAQAPEVGPAGNTAVPGSAEDTQAKAQWLTDIFEERYGVAFAFTKE